MCDRCVPLCEECEKNKRGTAFDMHTGAYVPTVPVMCDACEAKRSKPAGMFGPAIEVTSHHVAIGAGMLLGFRDRGITETDAVLAMVVAISELNPGNTAGIENVIFLLAQLPQMDGRPMREAIFRYAQRTSEALRNPERGN